MNSETFPHCQAVHDYAKAQGLEYVFQGTTAFDECKRTLRPEEYQVMAVHNRAGLMVRVVLYPRAQPDR